VSAFKLVAAQKANHPISVMAEVVGVGRTGFTPGSGMPRETGAHDAWLTEQNQGDAGRRIARSTAHRGIHAELRMARGINVSRKRGERLMCEAQISGPVPKRKGKTTTVSPPSGSPMIWCSCSPRPTATKRVLRSRRCSRLLN
jgi:hypothetical protein